MCSNAIKAAVKWVNIANIYYNAFYKTNNQELLFWKLVAISAFLRLILTIGEVPKLGLVLVLPSIFLNKVIKKNLNILKIVCIAIIPILFCIIHFYLLPSMEMPDKH